MFRKTHKCVEGKDVAVRSLVPRSVCGSAVGPTVDSFPLRQEQNPVDPRIHFATLLGMARSPAHARGHAQEGIGPWLSRPVDAMTESTPLQPERAGPKSPASRATAPEKTRKSAGTGPESRVVSRRARVRLDPGSGTWRNAQVFIVTIDAALNHVIVSLTTTRGPLQGLRSS